MCPPSSVVVGCVVVPVTLLSSELQYVHEVLSKFTKIFSKAQLCNFKCLTVFYAQIIDIIQGYLLIYFFLTPDEQKIKVKLVFLEVYSSDSSQFFKIIFVNFYCDEKAVIIVSIPWLLIKPCASLTISTMVSLELYLVSSKSDSSSLPSSLLDSSELPSSSSSDSSRSGSESFLGMSQDGLKDTKPVGYLNPNIKHPVGIKISI